MGDSNVVSASERAGRQSIKRFPIVEIFGPTIQGEGLSQGKSCYFIRFGGCDYRCSWCDSPHAVLPWLVRASARLTVQEIVDLIEDLPRGPEMIVLSGGNPCLHDLEELIEALDYYYVTLETQGTMWKNWIVECDQICVSPKPPSSGHRFDEGKFAVWMAHFNLFGPPVYFKVVIFDQRDYEFARKLHIDYPQIKMFLSAGNDAGMTVGNPVRLDDRTDQRIAEDLITKGRWLANRVMVDPAMCNTQVQMQQHVLYWGNQRGH